MEGKKIKFGKGFTYIASVLAFFYFSYSFAEAASLFIAPSSGNYNVGSNFSIVVKVNTSGQPINAAEGVIVFNPNELSVVSLSKSGSIFNLWIQEPEFSNALGNISFGGIIFNPGFTGSSGTLLTINFKAKAVGSTIISLSSGSVLANDGSGTNILSNLSGGLYTLKTTSAIPAPPPIKSEVSISDKNQTPTTGIPGAPAIKSSTHPDQEKWYKNNNPEFSWELPPNVTNLSFLIHPKPDGNPGNVPDGLKNSAKFNDFKDGTNYFHLKFNASGTWGPVAHYRFNIDSRVPKEFEILRLDNDLENPRPRISFETNDETSGIDHYELKIGNGDWFTVDKNLAADFQLPFLIPRIHAIEAMAFDNAENSVSASGSIKVEAVPKPLIIEKPEKPIIEPGENFKLKGSAEPGTRIIIIISEAETRRFGSIISALENPELKRIEVVVDENGEWTSEIENLKPGKYKIEIYKENENGAVSEPEIIQIQVGKTRMDTVLGIFDSVINFIGKNWLLFGLAAIIAGVLIIFKKFRRRISKFMNNYSRPKKEIKLLSASARKNRKKIYKKLEHVIRDIEEELHFLNSIDKRHGLKLEEKYLKNKLEKYIEVLKIISKLDND